uniref:Uncharacterized protein n=1 Tax=viral metagenome TaxID=1070528 RepID=A0A6M3J916_9ZZZZ
MAVYRIVAPGRFIGVSTDTKPTRANESQVVAGATFYEYDTGNMYITYDGTTWTIKGYDGATTKTVTGSSSGAGLAAYAANDIICNSTGAGTTITFTAIAKENGGSGYITNAKITFGTAGQVFRPTMLIFNALPVGGTLMDNALNLHPQATDTAKYIGKVDWVSLENLNSGIPNSQATPSTPGNLPLAYKCTSGADDLYGVLVTRDSTTAGTNMLISVDLTVEN